MAENSDLLDQTFAAKSLGISPRTLQKWRSTGEVQIPFVKVGRCVRYSLDDLEEFKKSNTVKTGGAA